MKQGLVILAGALLALGIAACGNESEDNGVDTTAVDSSIFPLDTPAIIPADTATATDTSDTIAGADAKGGSVDVKATATAPTVTTEVSADKKADQQATSEARRTGTDAATSTSRRTTGGATAEPRR